jgi:hypothetical protein
MLAVERFTGTRRGGQAVVIATYFATQWLVALSVDGARGR